MTNDAQEWVMVCTVDGDFWLLNVVNDEVAAIDAYRDHLDVHGSWHAEGIGMYRMTEAIKAAIQLCWREFAHGDWLPRGDDESSHRSRHPGLQCTEHLQDVVTGDATNINLFHPPAIDRNVGIAFTESKTHDNCHERAR